MPIQSDRRASNAPLAALALFDRTFTLILTIVCVALFATMLAAVGLQVFMRYGMNAPLIWSEELARFSMIWLAFLSAALAARKGQHIVISGLFTPSSRTARMFQWAVTLVFITTVAIIGWQGWLVTQRTSFQLSTALQLPMSYIYSAIPICSGLMIVSSLLALFVHQPDDSPVLKKE